MKWTENLFLKALAFIIAVAAFTASAMMGWYQIMNFDILWGDAELADSYTVRYLEQKDFYNVRALLELYNEEALGQELSITGEQNKAWLEDLLDTAQTNLRWQALSAAGDVLYGNTEEQIPSRALGLYQWGFTWTRAAASAEVGTGQTDWLSAAEDAVNVAEPGNVIYAGDPLSELYTAVLAYWDGTLEDGDLDTVYLSLYGETEVLTVTDEAGLHVYGPSVRAVIAENEYGYRYEEGEWVQVENRTGKQTETLTLVLWLASGLPVHDRYQQACVTLQDWQSSRELRLAATAVCAAVGLALMVCLCVGAGHRRGTEGVYLNWFHRIPGDLLLCVLLLGAAAVVSATAEVIAYSSWWSMAEQLALVGAAVSSGAAMGMAGLITFTARCKAHTLVRNTLLWRLWRWCRRAARRIIRAVPLVWKAVLVGMGYILFTLVTFRGSAGLWLTASLVLAAYLCLWAYQWKRVRQGTQEIIGGNPDYHIDTRYMLPDLRQHADELNNLGRSISAAVDDRMRSEHFKAELITNVSHDLKTPLTSIINYVDLLKKEEIDNPRAAEYIEVLDRKSQRLKKLTEDLVEASKASTGSLTVNWERLDLSQLVDQAAAEYLERLESQRLTVVRTLPDEPVWVEADGRHLWRIIDNLLSNCAKYALEGTRIYVSIQRYADCAVLSVKNISRDALNVPVEQLMERFVRGDESRTAEGSGLGLSIAQSLTELQHGRFEISIDGDLFKASVTLPLAGEPPEEQAQCEIMT